MGAAGQGAGGGEIGDWRRLIFWRPRPGFSLPAEWADRLWIPLGELRLLLQAVSPVRDLADIWRWVADPMPLAEVEAAIAGAARVEARLPRIVADRAEWELHLRVRSQKLHALLIEAGTDRTIERIELAVRSGHWLEAPAPEAAHAMLAVAAALRSVCGAVAVAL